MSIRTKIITATVAVMLGTILASGVAVAYTGVPASFTFTKRLNVGSNNQDVVYLKIVLANEGCVSGLGNTTYFGVKTGAAAKCFKAKYGVGTGTTLVATLTNVKLNQLIAGTTPPVVIVPTGAGLNVALAADNPASGTIVAGQAVAPLVKLTFTNGDNAEVKVTSLKLKRTGVSADASLTNIYLFDGATRLTDGAAVSSTVINFNLSSGIFTVPAGGSKTITVSSDICTTTACSTVSGQTIVISVIAASDVITNASSVKGTFPVQGNVFTVASGTLAGVEFNATTTPAASSIDPQDDYTMWQNSVIVTTRAVDMTRISFRKTGSVKNADLQNFRLYVDGVLTGSAVTNLDANGFVTFDLTSAPKRMEAGTRVIKLLGNIVGGSSLTFTFNLWSSADVTVIDSQYLANTLPDLISDAAFTKRSSGEQSVNSGVVTITKMTDSPSGNIIDAASNATLAKFQVKAAGEAIKIETLKVSVVVSTAAVAYLRNGMLLANGVQIGSTANLYDTTSTSPYYTSFSLGSSLIVEPLSPVTLEVRADIYDNDGTNSIVAGTTIAARIEGSSSENNAEGRVSAATIDAPAADVNGNTLTVATGGLTLAKYASYVSHSVVAPLSAYKLAEFTLTANTNEAVNVSTIEVDLNSVSAWTTNLYVDFGGMLTSVKPTVTATNTWSVNKSLTVGQAINVKVYGDVSSSAGATGIASMLVSGTTASSGTTVCAGTTSVCSTYAVLAGQTLTFASGTFAEANDGTTPEVQIVAGGQTVTAAKYKFTATNDSATIKEVKVLLSSTANSTIVEKAQLVSGSTILQERSFDTTTTNANDTAYFTGLSVAVPANTTKSLSVNLVLGTPNATQSTDGLNVITALQEVTWANSQGTQTIDVSGTAFSSVTGSALYVFKTIPTITVNELPSGQGTSLSAGSSTTLYTFSIKADAKGDIALKQLKFPVTITDAGTVGTLTLGTFKFFRGSTDLTTISVDIQDSVLGETIESTNSINEGTSTVVVAFTTEEIIPAGSTYTYSLKATPSGFVVSSTGNDSVSTYLNTDVSTYTTGNDHRFFYDAATADGVYGIAEVKAGTEHAVNILWSDMSAVSHEGNTNGSSSNDWSTGYLVKNTPLDAKGITAQ